MAFHSKVSSRDLAKQELFAMFSLLDMKGEGDLDFPEFTRGLTTMNVDMSESQMRRVFDEIDAEGNNFVDEDSFLHWLQEGDESMIEGLRIAVRTALDVDSGSSALGGDSDIASDLAMTQAVFNVARRQSGELESSELLGLKHRHTDDDSRSSGDSEGSGHSTADMSLNESDELVVFGRHKQTDSTDARGSYERSLERHLTFVEEFDSGSKTHDDSSSQERDTEEEETKSSDVKTEAAATTVVSATTAQTQSSSGISKLESLGGDSVETAMAKQLSHLRDKEIRAVVRETEGRKLFRDAQHSGWSQTDMDEVSKQMAHELHKQMGTGIGNAVDSEVLMDLPSLPGGRGTTTVSADTGQVLRVHHAKEASNGTTIRHSPAFTGASGPSPIYHRRRSSGSGGIVITPHPRSDSIPDLPESPERRSSGSRAPLLPPRRGSGSRGEMPQALAHMQMQQMASGRPAAESLSLSHSKAMPRNVSISLTEQESDRDARATVNGVRTTSMSAGGRETAGYSVPITSPRKGKRLGVGGVNGNGSSLLQATASASISSANANANDSEWMQLLKWYFGALYHEECMLMILYLGAMTTFAFVVSGVMCTLLAFCIVLLCYGLIPMYGMCEFARNAAEAEIKLATIFFKTLVFPKFSLYIPVSHAVDKMERLKEYMNDPHMVKIMFYFTLLKPPIVLVVSGVCLSLFSGVVSVMLCPMLFLMDANYFEDKKYCIFGESYKEDGRYHCTGWAIESFESTLAAFGIFLPILPGAMHICKFGAELLFKITCNFLTVDVTHQTFDHIIGSH